MSDDVSAGPDSSPAGAAREPKIIKRYTNRKLYDTVESRYVTLDEIADMIKAGADVKVIDNRTKEDLTAVTFAQIIFEEEKKTSKTSLRTLRELIRHGGERAQQFVEDTQAELRGRVEAVRQAAEHRVQTLLKTGQVTSDRAKELVAASQEAVAQFQRRVDDRLRTALDGMSAVPDLRRDLQELAGRIAELERKLDALDK
jgi:polyhydroxyalkanoate synthesis repressor PhaR